MLAALCCSMTVCLADEPPLNPSLAIIEKLKSEGDRLADQADYSEALEKYTQAYHGVVSNIRGQRFSKRVLPNLLTRDELGKEILRLMKDEFTDEEIRLMDASYKVFGLMPTEMKSNELMSKLLTEEVAGFYDPDSKRMVLIRENGSHKKPGWLGKLFGAKPAFDKDEQKTTLAHEMTHALQDQLYDLNAMEKGIEGDDDMMLAFSALVEGDATALMFVELGDDGDLSKMDPEAMRATFNMMSWMLPVAGGATYRKSPAIFRESLTFPYFQGMYFCLSIAAESSWPSIHAAYSNPPTSSEQILHPKKFMSLDERDEPMRVTIPELASVLNGAWKHLGGNCLGEFQTSVMLRRIPAARRAAAGWDGDRYEVFERGDGKLAVVYAGVWDTERDAKEFAQAFTEYRMGIKPNRQGSDVESQEPAETKAPTPATGDAANADDSKPGDGARITTAPYRNSAIASDSFPLIRQNADQVWIIDGFSSAESEKIAKLLPGIKLEVKRFPNPAKLTP